MMLAALDKMDSCPLYTKAEVQKDGNIKPLPNAFEVIIKHIQKIFCVLFDSLLTNRTRVCDFFSNIKANTKLTNENFPVLIGESDSEHDRVGRRGIRYYQLRAGHKAQVLQGPLQVGPKMKGRCLDFA
jgi:hypothetical protein